VTIAVLDYGSGNLHSVARAVQRVGGRPLVSDDASAVRRASALVVPGVGHFGACVRALASRGLDEAVREFAEGGRQVLGVCLGMQILLEGSDEDGAHGLGILPGRSTRLRTGSAVKVPHMGWNDVEWTSPHPFTGGVPSGTSFYFVHSYAPEVMPTATVGVTVHGRRFSSAIARGNVFGTQFHPEKSGDAGLALYEAFVKEARA
jgi:imidazole glycerol-phosphate synthase subunit HisH